MTMAAQVVEYSAPSKTDWRLFDAVKNGVSVRDAAERYGIPVNRRGMCKCPFHEDRNPSMKVDKRYHCFGCQADGDVISFTSRLFGFNRKAAAYKLASDFGIRADGRETKVIPFRNATDRNLQNIHRFQLIGIKNASSFAAEKALIHIGSPIISRSNRRFDRPLYIPARVYKNFDFTPSLAECIQGQFCSTFLIIVIQGYVFSAKMASKSSHICNKMDTDSFFLFSLIYGLF